MSEIKTKAPYEGQMVDAVEIPIIRPEEHWNEYKLQDGTTIRIKFVVASILRLIDKYDAEGSPAYAVKGTVVTVPLTPDSLRRRG